MLDMTEQRLWCNTCKFAKIVTKTYDGYGDITEIFCTKINRDIDLLTCEQPHWFFDVGCASHSDAVSEREKVLDELEERFRQNFTYLKTRIDLPEEYKEGRLDSVGGCLSVIQELRKQGERK